MVKRKDHHIEVINVYLGKLKQEFRDVLCHFNFVLIFKFREYGDNEVDFEEYEYDNEGK